MFYHRSKTKINIIASWKMYLSHIQSQVIYITVIFHFALEKNVGCFQFLAIFSGAKCEATVSSFHYHFSGKLCTLLLEIGPYNLFSILLKTCNAFRIEVWLELGLGCGSE